MLHGAALAELQEQVGVVAAAEYPQVPSSRPAERLEFSQRRQVLGLPRRGDAKPRHRERASHCYTAPSANVSIAFFTSAMNLSASEPSTTR